MNVDSLDKKLSSKILSSKHRSKVLDAIAFFSARYLVFLIGLIALWETGLSIILVFLIAWSITLVLEIIFQRARPYKFFHKKPLAKYWTPTPSFPSAHATITFAFAGSVFFTDPLTGSLLLVLATFVSLSRVYVGVHYLSDIIAGALIGFIVSWAMYGFM